MRVRTRTIVSALVVAALAAAPIAQAKAGDVRVSGTCTGPSKIKLTAGARNGSTPDALLQITLDVDSNRNGVGWAWTIADNDESLAGVATTLAPGGEFRVRRFTANGSGTDRVDATARNQLTGETCTATLVV